MRAPSSAAKRGRLASAAARLALAALAVAAAVLIAEGALAAFHVRTDWRYCSGWAVDDMDCRYALKPGVFDNDGAGTYRVNALGTRGPEPDEPSALCLGDSCTFGVRIQEESIFPSLLDPRPGAVVNAGIPGYNAFLGLQWLERSRFLERRPKLVTLYYGWNDQRLAAAPERVFFYLRRLSRYSRVAGVLLRGETSLWSDEPQWTRLRWCRTVPLFEFKHDLRRMIAEIRAAGAQPVLVTAAVEPRFYSAGDAARMLRDHDAYAGAVRQVARETGAGLVDFDAVMKSRAAASPDEYFIDHVHLSARGHRALADLLLPWVRCAQSGTCAKAGT